MGKRVKKGAEEWPLWYWLALGLTVTTAVLFGAFDLIIIIGHIFN
jgi:hypothetical protein